MISGFLLLKKAPLLLWESGSAVVLHGSDWPLPSRKRKRLPIPQLAFVPKELLSQISDYNDALDRILQSGAEIDALTIRKIAAKPAVLKGLLTAQIKKERERLKVDQDKARSLKAKIELSTKRAREIEDDEILILVHALS
jgi:hypothetical protein